MVNMVTAAADVDGLVVDDLGAVDLTAVLGGCVGAVGVVVVVDVGLVDVAAPAGFWAGCGLAGVREFRFVVTAAFFARSHGVISGFSCSSRTEHPPVKH